MSLDFPLFCLIWHLVMQWFGICAADPHHVLDHFIQFGQISGNSKSLRYVLYLIWFACVWTV